MVTLSLDVSTTSTGLVLLDHNAKKVLAFRDFKASGEVRQRIIKIAKDIKEYIVDKQFDVLIISKASYAQMNPNILMLEGILLGIAIDKGVIFEYLGDSSWWRFLGPAQTERPAKKKIALEFALEKLGLKDKVLKYDIKQTKNNRTSAYRFDKISAILEDGTTISDDITDAFCAGYFYPMKSIDNELTFEKTEAQNKLNSLRKQNKTLRDKINSIKKKIRVLEIERKDYENLFQAKQHKSYENSMLKRSKDIKDLELQIIQNEHTIRNNIDDINDLMELKEKIEEKKNNI